EYEDGFGRATPGLYLEG
ncbi:hypothetical protein A2U01_0090681, partial [Trifolium medium]|nr:hypothetical protein [Trifolium medium]